MKIALRLIAFTALVIIGLSAHAGLSLPSFSLFPSYTNFYSAGEVELNAGIADSYAATQEKRANYGLEIGGTYWLTLHTGTGLRMGVNDVTRPSPFIFDYSQVDYSVRFFWSHLAYGARLGEGKSFDDGSAYTEPDIVLEYRFTKNFGLQGYVGDKFCLTRDAGFRGQVGLSWNF